MMRSLVSCLLLSGSAAFSPLAGIRMKRVKDRAEVDFGTDCVDSTKCTLVILGTYAADFNAIEYGQRLAHYMPQLKAKGVDECKFILNASPESCEALASMLELPDEAELFSDPSGAAGLAYGVGKGWLPDDDSMSPYLKLFGMLFGLGAPLTLPYVIMGYTGNPFGKAGWIESSLAVGQRQGRWPSTALELDSDGSVAVNKFSELPGVGGWGRRPLELATLRLQNMLGISISKWGDLKPDLDSYPSVLTQLGGCVVVGAGGEVKYEWRDPGICAVASFDDILKKL
mmetsp:Transcript_35058/g.79186  ORF Transcript_35058/g.79186 Transcript_35058/m.79186 type:complete len:285 (-) Transcript_35058:25-879(-)